VLTFPRLPRGSRLAFPAKRSYQPAPVTMQHRRRPMPALRWLAENIGTIQDFWAPQECDSAIAMSEARRHEAAPVSTAGGMVMIKDLRNNDRVMFDDPDAAEAIYRRTAPFLLPRFKKKWEPAGLNERLGYYRYDVGQQFDWHMDGYFERPNGERSFFTFMIYLNDDFEGGGTSFRDNGLNGRSFGALRVRPKKGMALIFNHPIPHRGDPVTAGRKYVVRTDVMYMRRAASAQA
jgi:2OG-Fe(II) oxygenase superfamily